MEQLNETFHPEFGEYRTDMIENYNNSKNHYIVIMITVQSILREKVIEGFDTYDNFVLEATNN